MNQAKESQAREIVEAVLPELRGVSYNALITAIAAAPCLVCLERAGDPDDYYTDYINKCRELDAIQERLAAAAPCGKCAAIAGQVVELNRQLREAIAEGQRRVAKIAGEFAEKGWQWTHDDEAVRLMMTVVNAAASWHQSGREGDETWFDKGELLGQAVDKLLELRGGSNEGIRGKSTSMGNSSDLLPVHQTEREVVSDNVEVAQRIVARFIGDSEGKPSGTLPLLLRDAIAASLTTNRNAQIDRVVKVVGSFITIHKEIVSNNDLVLNAKLREIITALEAMKGEL